MTENLKKFFEFLSQQDAETREKAAKLEKDALIAFAAEKGFTLTDADFEKQDAEGEVSLDEADTVAGGGDCYCAIAGGGTEELHEAPYGASGDGGCACVLYGQGDEIYQGEHYTGRCYCVAGGMGSAT